MFDKEKEKREQEQKEQKEQQGQEKGKLVEEAGQPPREEGEGKEKK